METTFKFRLLNPLETLAETIFRAAPHTVIGAKFCVTTGAISLSGRCLIVVCAHVPTSPELCKIRLTAIIGLVAVQKEEDREAKGKKHPTPPCHCRHHSKVAIFAQS